MNPHPLLSLVVENALQLPHPSASQLLSSPLHLTAFAAYGTYKAAFEIRLGSLEQVWSWTQRAFTFCKKPKDSKYTLNLTLHPLVFPRVTYIA